MGNAGGRQVVRLIVGLVSSPSNDVSFITSSLLQVSFACNLPVCEIHHIN